MRPGSFCWWPATEQGAMDTNWYTGSSMQTWGRTFPVRVIEHWKRLLRGLWIFLLWRYSKPAWTSLCTTYSRDFAGGWTRWSPWGLSNPCDSVKRSRWTRSTPFCVSHGYNYCSSFLALGCGNKVFQDSLVDLMCTQTCFQRNLQAIVLLLHLELAVMQLFFQSYHANFADVPSLILGDCRMEFAFTWLKKNHNVFKHNCYKNLWVNA